MERGFRGAHQPGSKGAESPPIDLDLRPLLGVDEVANLLGIPKATHYRWRSMSTVEVPVGPRAFRVGRYLRYTLEDVRSYIERLRHTAS